MHQLNAALDLENKRPKIFRGGAVGSSRKNKKNEPKQFDIPVGLAYYKFPLMFKNQFKEYCAVIEKNGVYEVVPMESEDFSSAIQHLWAEYNLAENRPEIVTIQKNMVEQTIFALKSEVNYRL